MTPDNQTPAEPTPEPALLALAREKFGALSRAEEELFRAAQEGRPASVLTGDEKESDPANAENWTADRLLRAECISWVCTNPQASVFVTHRGLELQGMRISGALNLSTAEIKVTFTAWKCAFSEDISLRDARLRGVYLIDCRIKSLTADRAFIDGSLLLRDGFKAESQVNLSAIKIGGDLDCSGAQFLNANGLALSASGAKIDGSVFLRGSRTAGEINLLRATIGGNLDCDGAQFSNAGSMVLNANSAKITGTVFLRGGFKAEGAVNLLGAAIDGNVECDGAQLSNAKGLALIVNGAKIQGNIFLRGDVKAEGEVNLVRATIGGNFECDRAQFSNVDGLALNADSAKVEGNVFLRDGFQAKGEVRLLGATFGDLQILKIIGANQMVLDLRLTKVETFWDDEESWPTTGNLFLDGFRYERLYEEGPFEADKRKKWLSLQPGNRYRPQPYEQLGSVLRQMGHNGEARKVMIEKNLERARLTHFRQQGWWWYNLFGKLIGYGYRPGRAFCISLVMILLGTILFACGFAHDLISPTGENAYVKEPNGQVIEENKRPKISEKYPVFHAFAYSLESFTPLLKFDQSAHWTPNANHHAEISSFCRQVPISRHVPFSGSFLRYYLYFHIAAGWLLTSLWVGAITGLVKT